MLHLTISQGDGISIYLQLIRQIKALIASGRLKPDGEMPSVRQLSEQLVINPNTVVRAYRELELEGLVYKRRGAGTFVAAQVTPYSDEVCRRILGERIDTLIVEAVNLGYGEEEVIELFREHWQIFHQHKSIEEGE
jgi:GntR family transcriptional regulator